MGRVNETVRTVNSAVRTFLFGAMLAGASFVGWKGYSVYNEPQQKLADKQRELEKVEQALSDVRQDLDASRLEAESLAQDLTTAQAENDRLQTSLRLIKLRRRIARIRVLDQRHVEDVDNLVSTIEFFEVNEEGAPTSSRDPFKFEIVGDRIYVDYLVAKFDDKYVEQNDLDRNTAICLFQRIYGEFQEPQEGFEIEEAGSSPMSYARGGVMSDFERKIWDDFWTIASDPKQAEDLGIRAAHGVAPSIRVQKGATYELKLSSTGEFAFKRLEDAPAG